MLRDIFCKHPQDFIARIRYNEFCNDGKNSIARFREDLNSAFKNARWTNPYTSREGIAGLSWSIVNCRAENNGILEYEESCAAQRRQEENAFLAIRFRDIFEFFELEYDPLCNGNEMWAYDLTVSHFARDLTDAVEHENFMYGEIGGEGVAFVSIDLLAAFGMVSADCAYLLRSQGQPSLPAPRAGDG